MQRSDCLICQAHDNQLLRQTLEIAVGEHWTLRHHPNPSPRVGWLFLDSNRHIGGPIDFSEPEANQWGIVVKRCSALIKSLTGADRVYAVAFGEGAQHLHLHLIPRFIKDSETKAWDVADLYRETASGLQGGAPIDEVKSFVERARVLILEERIALW